MSTKCNTPFIALCILSVYSREKAKMTDNLKMRFEALAAGGTLVEGTGSKGWGNSGNRYSFRFFTNL